MMLRTKVTLWILWKYRCKRQYDSIIPLLSYILPELWENLLAVVFGQYDTIAWEKITAVMEEATVVHGLLSRTNLELPSPLVIAPTISFVHSTL